MSYLATATRFALTLLILAGGSGCQLHSVSRPGPLRVRNQHPVQLTTLRMGPRAARASAPGSGEAGLVVDWTNIWLLDGSGEDTVRFDGEWLRAQPRLQVGVLPGLDVEVSVPLLHASGGVLDGFVEGWHELFGFADDERSENSRDDFRVQASRGPGAGGAVVYQLEDHGVHVGDVPVIVSWFPGDPGGERAWGFGLRGGIELATGDEDDGVGNGGIDTGLGFVAEYTRDCGGVYVWGEQVWVHTPDRAKDAGVDYADAPAAGVAFQLGVSPAASLLLQADWERSALRRLDQSNASRDQVMLWLGGRFQLADRVTFDLAIGEDLVRQVSADVTFHAALSYAW